MPLDRAPRLDKLAAIHAECFAPLDKPAWDEVAIANLLAMEGVSAYTIRDVTTPSRQIVAFAITRKMFDVIELLTICVSAGYRRYGFAMQLLDEISLSQRGEIASRVLLEVATSNQRAIDVYQRAGFSVIGTRRGYYRGKSGAVDALIMEKQA